MPRSSISMRELQKMSAGAIQALDGPVTIRSGSAEVGILYPISQARQEKLDTFMRLAEQADARTTPEERERYDRFLVERGE
jgi:hypothetical protein